VNGNFEFLAIDLIVMKKVTRFKSVSNPPDRLTFAAG
jgi:hypothetical protein